MAKMLRFDDMARMALKRGVDQVADAVKVTLGPRGRNVILNGPNEVPVLTNDGITIARRIDLADPYENLGAQLLREVATKTQETAGDGTTTATLLAQAIVSEGLMAVSAGENPIRLRRGIERAVDFVIDVLRSEALVVEDREELERIATLASKQAKPVATHVAHALSEVGSYGIVRVERGVGRQSRLRWSRGFEFDRGYLSPYFVTEPGGMQSVLDDPRILLCDFKITDLVPLIPILEEVAAHKAPFLIVAEDIEGEALATLVMNRLRGALDVVAVKAPAFGERRTQILEDMAVATGAQLVSRIQGMKLENVTFEDLGRAARAVVTRDGTTIIEGGGAHETVEERKLGLESLLGESGSEYERERVLERLARLTGRIAVLELGGTTDLEIEDHVFRAQDALASTRAAMEEGVVPGGGVSVLRAGAALSTLKAEDEAEQAGIEIVRKALEAPLFTIAENAGYDGRSVVDQVLSGQGDFGFDAETGALGSLSEVGILDALKVVRTGLQNAASIGSLILTTETLVADRPDSEEGGGKES